MKMMPYTNFKTLMTDADFYNNTCLRPLALFNMSSKSAAARKHYSDAILSVVFTASSDAAALQHVARLLTKWFRAKQHASMQLSVHRALVAAVSNGFPQTTALLLNTHYSVNKQRLKLWFVGKLIVEAARLGHRRVLETICRELACTAPEMDDYMRDALHLSMQLGHVATARFLLRSGARFPMSHDHDNKHLRALLSALERGHRAAARLVLRQWPLPSEGVQRLLRSRRHDVLQWLAGKKAFVAPETWASDAVVRAALHGDCLRCLRVVHGCCVGDRRPGGALEIKGSSASARCALYAVLLMGAAEAGAPDACARWLDALRRGARVLLARVYHPDGRVAREAMQKLRQQL